MSGGNPAQSSKAIDQDTPPFSRMPDPETVKAGSQAPRPPDDSRCFQLWDKYKMLDNVRGHSLLVARIADFLARKAHERGLIRDVQEVRASALLHDIAKTYCLRYGGSHALLGASWTLRETGQPRVAQGVILHVNWPWPLPPAEKICSLPFLVMYADKRVKHSDCVTLSERFEDLIVRYGKTEAAREGIRNTWRQTRRIERSLSELLGINLNEYSFNCGRLVNGA